VKLMRVGAPGRERPALMAPDGALRDLAGIVLDIAGEALTTGGLDALRGIESGELPLLPADVCIGPPIGAVGKMICVGLNYADHAAESGMAIPELPIIFMRATTAIVGPNDELGIRRGSHKTDWEVELGVVIGDVARDVSREQALKHVAGYLAVHDVSGPWLVTREEIADPQKLALWLEVNGHRYQAGSTRTMIFDVAYLVSHISRYMTLMPGDIISTGTPPGVGMGQKPQVFLAAGDVVELGIEGLGRQRQHVVGAS
jgi:2,4-diketo-3-deoxy-L-fuconate hydrolase